MKNITIGENVSVIGREAFYGCNNLQHIFIQSNIYDIGKNAFGDISRKAVFEISDLYFDGIKDRLTSKTGYKKI